jgi:acyl dehydratase
MADTVTTNISAAMQSAVGRELGRQVSFPVSESDIRRWAIAVYYPEPPPRRFVDAVYAETTSLGGIVAPEEFNPFAWMVASAEGRTGGGNDTGATEKALDIEPPDLHHMLNGGMEVEYGAPVRPGDVITAVTRLGGYRERAGRLGLMLFTTLENTWTNQRDELVRRTHGTVIRY